MCQKLFGGSPGSVIFLARLLCELPMARRDPNCIDRTHPGLLTYMKGLEELWQLQAGVKWDDFHGDLFHHPRIYEGLEEYLDL